METWVRQERPPAPAAGNARDVTVLGTPCPHIPGGEMPEVVRTA